MVTTVKSREPSAPSLFGMSTVGQAINLHKALTLPLMLCLMYLHGNYTQPAVLYCFIHGIYGMMWLLKHLHFRDRNFDTAASKPLFVQVFCIVSLYWVAPYMLMRYRKDEVVPAWELCSVLSLYTVGMFLHYVSDCQKFYILSTRGRGLITNGLFSLVRNPNYLGEVLIYAAFTLLCRSYVGLGITLFFWVGVFLPNMLKKDESLSKYKEFADYKARTWLILPYIY